MSRIAAAAQVDPEEVSLSSGRSALVASSISIRGLLANGMIDDGLYLTIMDWAFAGGSLPDMETAMRIERVLVSSILIDPVCTPDDVANLPDLEVGELVGVALRLLRDPFRRGDGAESVTAGVGAQVGDEAECDPRPRTGKRSGGSGGHARRKESTTSD